MVTIQLRILDARIRDHMPAYVTAGAAGMDLRACVETSITIAPGDTHLVPTGIAIHIADKDFAAMILPRSGLGHKHGIVLGNPVGLIDSDYQGPLMVSCWNRGREPYTLAPLDRIAQLVVIPVVQVQLSVIDEFVATPRGTAGFGSSGKH